MDNKSLDFRMVTPFRLLLAGPSGIGKTTLLFEILEKSEETMTESPSEVHIFFTHMQPAYEEYSEKSSIPIFFHTVTPSNDFQCKPKSVVVFDDYQGDRQVTQVIKNFFIRKSHHENISVVHICQSLFDKDPSHRFISLNASHMIIFASPRDPSQIVHLNKQIYPGKKNFLVSVYSAIVKEGGNRSYLLIDLSPSTPEDYRLRNTCFPISSFPNAFVYVPTYNH